MREIKFRYTVVRVNGYIFHHDFTLHQIESPDVDRFIRVNHIGDTDSIYRRQFTGILDTNKKEIYEGDIVKADGFYFGDSFIKANTGVIAWADGSFVCESPRDTFGELNSCAVANYRVEIIGNLYENEDLLAEIR
jgi:uncharacterized phage protein (TIGR01671 family)